MIDPADKKTADMYGHDAVGPKRPRGRPRKYKTTEEKLAAAAAATRKCRIKAFMRRIELQMPSKKLSSKLIDLSAVPVWKRK